MESSEDESLLLDSPLILKLDFAPMEDRNQRGSAG